MSDDVDVCHYCGAECDESTTCLDVHSCRARASDKVRSLQKALRQGDDHLRAIIVYAKSGSELEATANDARKLIARTGVSVQP